MFEKWREKRKEKKQKEAEKWRKPTLEERLHELELKHGDLLEQKFIDGKIHYYFIDGSVVCFNSGFGGMEVIYKEKGFLYS